MSNLAANQLRQARLCAEEGDTSRATELLEQARVLVGNDAALRAEVLELLATLYESAGRRDEAARCRANLPQRPAVRPPPLPPGAVSAAPIANAPKAPEHRGSPTLVYGGLAVAIVLLLIVGGVVWRLWSAGRSVEQPAEPPQQIAQVTTTPTSRLAAPLPPAPAPAPATVPVVIPATAPVSVPVTVALTPVILPATKPAATAPVIPEPAPVVVVPPVTTAPSAVPNSKLDRQDLLKETVGLCVVVARYEGSIPLAGKMQIDLPVGTGTAFSITASGVMLTNRHVVNASKDAPLNLDKLHLPQFTRRNVSYVICFGPNPKNRFPAKLLHTSTAFDLAILKVEHHVEHPLILARHDPRQGDDILVCGYPGVVMDVLNESAETPAALDELTKKWEKTRKVDAFDGFSPDSFESTLTKGIVSAPNRRIEGANYVQIDAGISPGNSGGPVLNVDNEVIGIATLGLKRREENPSASYNFALSAGQLMEEIRPFLKK